MGAEVLAVPFDSETVLPIIKLFGEDCLHFTILRVRLLMVATTSAFIITSLIAKNERSIIKASHAQVVKELRFWLQIGSPA